MTLFHVTDEELDEMEWINPSKVNDDWVEDDEFMSFLYTMYCDE